MATDEQCRASLEALSARMAATGSAAGFERSLSCTVSDLGVIFSGQLTGGRLLDLTSADLGSARGKPAAQVRITSTSDDLVALIDGSLKVGPAMASGRLTIKAGVLDLLRLRSLF